MEIDLPQLLMGIAAVITAAFGVQQNRKGRAEADRQTRVAAAMQEREQRHAQELAARDQQFEQMGGVIDRLQQEVNHAADERDRAREEAETLRLETKRVRESLEAEARAEHAALIACRTENRELLTGNTLLRQLVAEEVQRSAVTTIEAFDAVDDDATGAV